MMTDAPTPPTPQGPRPDLDLENKKDDKDPKQGADAAFGTNVQLVEANSPMQLDSSKKVDPKGRYIQYNGPATVRIMDKAAWNAASVDSDKYVEWNYLNHKRIPLSSFTDEELTYLLRVDGRFSIVELDSDGKVKK